MRLSLSGEHTGDNYVLEAAIGNDAGDGGLPAGGLLNEFAEALCAGDEQPMAETRQKITAELGAAAMVDAAAVIAAFNGYPRIADATGIPLEDYKAEATEDMRVTLGLDALDLTQTS